MENINLGNSIWNHYNSLGNHPIRIRFSSYDHPAYNFVYYSIQSVSFSVWRSIWLIFEED